MIPKETMTMDDQETSPRTRGDDPSGKPPRMERFNFSPHPRG